MNLMRWLFVGLSCAIIVPGAAAVLVDGDDRVQAPQAAAKARAAERQWNGAPRLAQAGSTGGTLGKTDRSLSGGQPPKAPAPEVRQRAAAPAAKPEKGRGGCPNIVGTWNSWAAAIWGAGDVEFKSDGNAMHNAGIPGKWWCDRGQLKMTWGEGKQPGNYRVSDDGKQILNTDNGMVGFSR